ncbi:hypothetical protein GCM10027345_35520 [Hymenobacter daeguensis]
MLGSGHGTIPASLQQVMFAGSGASAAQGQHPASRRRGRLRQSGATPEVLQVPHRPFINRLTQKPGTYRTIQPAYAGPEWLLPCAPEATTFAQAGERDLQYATRWLARTAAATRKGSGEPTYPAICQR